MPDVAGEEGSMGGQWETRMHFVETLNLLMRTCPLEKVKVTHLCKATGVSRATFYEHFHDIFDVPVWFWDHLMERSLYRIGLDLSCYEAHFQKFALLRENKEFFDNAFKSDDYNSVCEHGGRAMDRIMVERAAARAGHPLAEEQLLLIEFFRTGAQYMTRDWVRHGMEPSPRVMAQLFYNSMPAFLVQLLDEGVAQLR